ncbi:MAG: Mur ligase family protein [Candidatus Magasanikbacteria bacterium]|nr:Mur ligase family protein [Candidatus Magasanikbacteria bacterium]
MRHIHFIGICGVGMSALAILWKKMGWKVTGSDAGFYPPISTHLDQNQIDFYAGWHPEKIGTPDLVVVGNVAGSENPEWLFVQEHNIKHISYPELIGQNLVRKNSIVCAGTWGKTSTTALLSYILTRADYKPAYMFGGLSLSLPYAADDLGGDWSVLEGDEYKTGKDNPMAKFFSYKPTYLLLTGLEWDHFDMYPTEESYYGAFKKLMKLLPENGLVLACTNSENIERVLPETNAKVIRYGTDNADYIFSEVTCGKDGISFKISSGGATNEIKSPMLGDYMAENICGAFAMASEIGVAKGTIIDAIGSFGGIKRRLENRGKTAEGATIFDDIAHSPIKARSVLQTLRNIYSGKIIAVFEPNTGNRQVSSAPGYDSSFLNADIVVIPRLTKIKIDEKTNDTVMDGQMLADIIARTHKTVKLISDDAQLVKYLKTAAGPEDAIVFLGSHGFRGMIESLID